MKKILKQFLKYYLWFWTKLALAIHKPIIVAVAGSINKSFFRDEIKKMLEQEGESVRANPKNFNTEIGLPLAILYLPSGYNSYSNWLPAIINAPKAVFKKFPKYLVLELGVSGRGDMQYLLSILKPKISVITDITQKYLEGFDGMDELVGEYEILIHKTKQSGLIILNYDNPRLREISPASQQTIKSFAIKNTADYQAVEISSTSDGQKIKIKTPTETFERKINRFGKHHAYALLASLIVKDYISKQYE